MTSIQVPAMPLGIITESTPQGGTFIYARNSDRGLVDPDTPIVIWNEFQGAFAKYRGLITEASENTAAFVITHSQVDPHWPDHVDPRGHSNPVYIGVPDSFLPDPTRFAQSQAEFDRLVELALQVTQDTGVPISAAVVHITPQPPVDTSLLE